MFMQQNSMRRATSGSPTAEVLDAFNPDSLRRIELGFGRHEAVVVLENLPDGWVVRSAFGHAAAPGKVDKLLRDLADLQGEIRSESASVLASYGFTDSTAVTVVAHSADPQPVFRLDVGSTVRPSGNFVREAGSSTVFACRTSILADLGLYSGPAQPKNTHFLDLQARKLDGKEVDAIRLIDGDEVLAMHKDFAEPVADEDDTTGVPPQIDRSAYDWKLTEPSANVGSRSRCDGVQNAVARVNAVDVVDPGADLATYGLDAPQKRAEVTLADGTGFALQFGAERPEDGDIQKGVYMQIEDEPTIWVVTDYFLNNLFKKTDDLLPEED